MHELALGKPVEYSEHYDPQLLQAVPRSLSREQIGLSANNLPFHGFDIWNGYELSWITPKGLPRVAILVCKVPFNSPNLIESKSFKLYLNSLNQSIFESTNKLKAVITSDLSNIAGADVDVTIIPVQDFPTLSIGDLAGDIIDNQDIEIDYNGLSPNVLRLHQNHAECEETLVSHLLKSNCLITNQPDWASVQIRYCGAKICRESLLRYLISFRQHNEFHEQCVERIFNDIMHRCKPAKLSVYARYTRRGGLDINPFRSNFESSCDNIRLARQ